MKKQKRIFLAFFAFIALVFCPSANALMQKVELTSVEIIDKSSTVTAEEPAFTNNTISSNITFGKEGDSIELKLRLKNTSEEDFKITGISDNTTSNFATEYNYSGNTVIAGDSTDIIAKMSYAQKVLNVDKISFDDITITLELTKMDGTKEIAIINPKTNDNIIFYVIIAAASALILIAIAIISHEKKTKYIAGIIALIGIITFPAAAIAIEEEGSSVGLSNIDLIGEFEVYTIQIDPNNGQNPTEKPVTYGNTLGDLPSAPQKDGYDFDKWVDGDGNPVDANTTITSQITVTANYTPKNYGINYNLDGGTLVNANRTSYTIETDTFTLVNPSKEYYDFAGWTGSNGTTPQKDVSVQKGTTGELTYTANYAPKNYTITFNPNGGEIAETDATRSIAYGSPLGALPSATNGENALAGWFTAAEGGDKIDANTVVSGETEYFAQWLDNRTLASNIVANEANDLGEYTINFARGAKVSDNVKTANGNGVNEYTENGQTIYYYRGEIEDNNVIWADKCWKILRTTATGGTKIVYNGEPTEVEVNGEMTYQCLATGADTLIKDENGNNYFEYNDGDGCESSGKCTYAYMGYMYGATPIPDKVYPKSNEYVFSDSVTRNGNTYTLNTSPGHSITGAWADVRTEAGQKYRYFCTTQGNTCNNAQIAYINDTNPRQSLSNINTLIIGFVRIGGYNDIDDYMRAVNANDKDSIAKTAIESWYERNLLDKGDDLEDAIFCNERTMKNGALANNLSDRDAGVLSRTISYMRLNGAASDSELIPSLDCSNTNDSFTTDPANGNGKLKYKIGMITADEATLSSLSVKNNNYQTSYLYSGEEIWTMTPMGLIAGHIPNVLKVSVYSITGESPHETNAGYNIGIRPAVSLKAGTRFLSGDGTNTNPYRTE